MKEPEKPSDANALYTVRCPCGTELVIEVAVHTALARDSVECPKCQTRHSTKGKVVKSWPRADIGCEKVPR